MKLRKREEWQKLVSDQIQSGMTISGWCRARGIRESTYAYWRQQCRREEGEGKFVRVDQSEPLTVVFGRFRIGVRRGFDEDALRRVLGVAKDAAI